MIKWKIKSWQKFQNQLSAWVVQYFIYISEDYGIHTYKKSDSAK